MISRIHNWTQFHQEHCNHYYDEMFMLSKICFKGNDKLKIKSAVRVTKVTLRNICGYYENETKTKLQIDEIILLYLQVIILIIVKNIFETINLFYFEKKNGKYCWRGRKHWQK